MGSAELVKTPVLLVVKTCSVMINTSLVVLFLCNSDH